MDIRLDEAKSTVYVKPSSPLTADCFSQLSQVIDPYVEKQGALKGLIIETPRFPGWANLNAFIAHVKFIKNHHAKIQKVAAVTDSKLVLIGRNLITPFVKPQIKQFPYGQLALATQWVDEAHNN